MQTSHVMSYVFMHSLYCNLSLCLPTLGPRPHPISRKTTKTPRLHELFRKVHTNFRLLPCNGTQEPRRGCSETFVQMNLYFGWIFSGGFSWELVDPVVADPVAQDNEKRYNIQIYTKFPIKIHRGRGQNFPIFISCPYLVELGPRQLGLNVSDFPPLTRQQSRWRLTGEVPKN